MAAPRVPLVIQALIVVSLLPATTPAQDIGYGPRLPLDARGFQISMIQMQYFQQLAAQQDGCMWQQPPGAMVESPMPAPNGVMQAPPTPPTAESPQATERRAWLPRLFGR